MYAALWWADNPLDDVGLKLDVDPFMKGLQRNCFIWRVTDDWSLSFQMDVLNVNSDSLSFQDHIILWRLSVVPRTGHQVLIARPERIPGYRVSSCRFTTPSSSPSHWVSKWSKKRSIERLNKRPKDMRLGFSTSKFQLVFQIDWLQIRLSTERFGKWTFMKIGNSNRNRIFRIALVYCHWPDWNYVILSV